MHKPVRTVHLESLPSHLWHACKHVAETVLAPLLAFYVLFSLTDLTGGLLAALGWAVGAMVCRLVVGAPIPMVLWLTTGLLLVRTVIGFATGSSFLYFLEPSLQNFLFASALLASLPFERTFIAKLADDFCVLPASLTGHPRVRRFFRRVSVLWALVFALNGVATLWVLAQATMEHFLVVSTVGSYALIALAAVASLIWFRRELRGEGIALRFGGEPAAA